jgi:RNA polymerase sigma factor FliA
MTTPEERAQWIKECQGLVHSLAWQMTLRLPGEIDVEDLASYGQIGLTQAANSFDPDRGVKFSTFAYYRIRGAIHDGLTEMLWYARKPVRGLECDRLANETLSNDQDSRDALAADETTWFRELAGGLATVFLIGGSVGANESSLEPEDEASQNPISRVSRQEIGNRLNELIDALPEAGRTLIRAAYFENQSLQEAANQLSISRSWASRLHAKTLKQLETALRQSGVDEA